MNGKRKTYLVKLENILPSWIYVYQALPQISRAHSLYYSLHSNVLLFACIHVFLVFGDVQPCTSARAKVNAATSRRCLKRARWRRWPCADSSSSPAPSSSSRWPFPCCRLWARKSPSMVKLCDRSMSSSAAAVLPLSAGHFQSRLRQPRRRLRRLTAGHRLDLLWFQLLPHPCDVCDVHAWMQSGKQRGSEGSTCGANEGGRWRHDFLALLAGSGLPPARLSVVVELLRVSNSRTSDGLQASGSSWRRFRGKLKYWPST